MFQPAMVVRPDELPVATGGEPPPFDHRLIYRSILACFGFLLIALLLGRGYGIEEAAAAGMEPQRKVDGEWVSVPFAVAPAPSQARLQVIVDGSACARVVRYQVVESESAVFITIWRRQMHPSCVPLSVAVDLDAPLGDRRIVDAGVTAS